MADVGAELAVDAPVDEQAEAGVAEPLEPVGAVAGAFRRLRGGRLRRGDRKEQRDRPAGEPQKMNLIEPCMIRGERAVITCPNRVLTWLPAASNRATRSTSSHCGWLNTL